MAVIDVGLLQTIGHISQIAKIDPNGSACNLITLERARSAIMFSLAVDSDCCIRVTDRRSSSNGARLPRDICREAKREAARDRVEIFHGQRTPFSNGRDKWRANDRPNRTTDSFVI